MAPHVLTALVDISVFVLRVSKEKIVIKVRNFLLVGLGLLSKLARTFFMMRLIH